MRWFVLFVVGGLALSVQLGCKSGKQTEGGAIPALDLAKKNEVAAAIPDIVALETAPTHQSLMAAMALVDLEAGRLRSSYLDLFRALDTPAPSERATMVQRAIEAARADVERDLKDHCPGLDWKAEPGSVGEYLAETCPTLCKGALECSKTMAEVPLTAALVVIGAFAFLDSAGPIDPVETALFNGVLTGEL
jgi:hypothetical protein